MITYMEQNLKLRLLESIGKVFEQSKNCKLDSVFFEKEDVELKLLSDYFKVSRIQSLIIAMVFALNYKGNTVNLKDLIEYFDCNPMKLLEFSDDFEALYSKGIFKKQKKASHRIRLTLANDQFTINEIITEAILNNKPMPDVKCGGLKNIIDLLEYFQNLSEQLMCDEISTSELLDETRKLISSNLHFPLIRKINDFKFNIEDSFLFLFLIWNTISGNETMGIGIATESIFDNPSARVYYAQKLMSNENRLLIQNHIQIVEAIFLNEMEIKLSDASVKMLKEFGLNIYVNKKNRNNIIDPAKISSKTLFFNEFEQKQLDLLKTLLLEDNFREAQSRLGAKGLPKGITALLHGCPGTGKTETVFQVARSTNREIVKVDISQSKSLWFGESEKTIKRIFTDYKSYAKDCERTPILLFNEADAIMSKRKEIGSSNISQTENTIQNIILEELEIFDGIFFATTNLVNNLDYAFERRFLFKIEFKKPEKTEKIKIWNSKLPCLTEAECEVLAFGFDLSGGQIDNIVRKNEIHEIIRGYSVDFNNIVEFCKTELLFKNGGSRIGFNKA